MRSRWVEPAEPLAALRIAVALVILISPELRTAPALAADPFALDRVPEGLGWLARIRLGPGVARGAEIVALSSGACALLGYWSRVSMLVLTLSGALAFSFSQRSGAVIHDMHLFWLSALLSVSRAGDALSLDAWGKPRPAASLAYGVPLAIARGLLGLVYFFPGIHKLGSSGLGWLTAENVVRQLHYKWVEFEQVPFFRLDWHPTLCVVGACFVVAFELGFVAFVQVPRLRLVAAAAGLLFHAITQLLFFIPFVSLWATYVMLLPFGSRRTTSTSASATAGEPWPRAPLAVGAVLLLLVTQAGARGQTQAWPFACYPTFAAIPRDIIPDLAFEVTHGDGRIERFDGRERGPRSQFEWRRVFYLAGAAPSPARDRALRDFSEKMAARAEVSLENATRLVAFRELYPTSPERWGRPVSATKLAELPVDRAPAPERSEFRVPRADE